MRTVLILPDGREVTSGAFGSTAVQSFSLTQCVNAGTELEAGAVCAAMAEIRLWIHEDLHLQAGDEISVYQEENGARKTVGVFLLEKPTHPTANTMAITAYDRIIKLDRDMTNWLAGYNRWPCPLQDLARDICDECDLTLADGEIPNAEYPVPKFAGEGITGRQLMQWIAQIAGRFVRASAAGQVEFGWYAPAEIAIAPDDRQSQYISARNGNVSLILPGGVCSSDGRGNVTIENHLLQAQILSDNLKVTVTGDMPAVFYYQNGLSFEDFQTQKISRVVLRQNQEDVGVGYPENSGEENPYAITGNPMLTAEKAVLQEVAECLFNQLKDVTYTPCKISIASTEAVYPGCTVNVQDRNGRFFTAYVMNRKRTGGKDLLECTGSYRRGTSTELNNQSFRSLQGRVLNLRKDVDGLFVSHEDTQDNLAQLKLSIGGLQATVQQQGKDAQVLTTLTQSAEDLQLRIKNLESNGTSQVKTETGYTFDQNGLHIQKSGQQMENTLDHTGMYVRRGSKTLLQANHQGVEATDVTVRNYLIVGEHARFEDYGGGTGCFWI